MVELDSIETKDGKVSLLFSVDTNDWKWLAKELKYAGLETINKNNLKYVEVGINGIELMFWTRD